ncbi:MAG: hypothetical protein ABH869_01000 [Candidatus Omnitrophota bacterium]
MFWSVFFGILNVMRFLVFSILCSFLSGCAILDIPKHALKTTGAIASSVGKIADAAGTTIAVTGNLAGKLIDSGSTVTAALIKTPTGQKILQNQLFNQ